MKLTPQQKALLKNISSEKERIQQKARFFRENQSKESDNKKPDN
jgi:hypothetical protein